MLEKFIELTLNLTRDLGYLGIIIPMTIESSFIPFPSEIIIIPYAILASQGKINLTLVILSGLLGSLIGASINYFLALFLGRKIIYKIIEKKLFKILLLNKKKIEKSELFFLKYGNISTFIGRLLPVIRQLVSLPAGFARMNFLNFLIFTGLGSFIWVIILAGLGYFLGNNKELINKYSKEISLFFLFSTSIILIFLYKKKYK